MRFRLAAGFPRRTRPKPTWRTLRIVDSAASADKRPRGRASRRRTGAGQSTGVSDFNGLPRMRNLEHAFPARLGEEVLGYVDHMVDGTLLEVGCGRVVRPIDQQRLADHILARNESPIAAVERIVAIVAEREELSRRDY